MVRRRRPFFCATLLIVGSRLARTALPCALFWALGSPASAADWQVRRASPAPLLDAALVALWQRPDDAVLAHRAIELAGHGGTPALRQRLRAHAESSADYPGYEAYAQVLNAMGDAAAAASAYEEALRLRPDSSAAMAGRARALAAVGDASAPAAYDQALAHEQRPAARRKLLEGALALLPAEPRGADLERAIALRRDIARLAPGDDRAALALSELLEHAGRPEDAATALDAHAALTLRAARLRGESADPAIAARGAAALTELLREVPATDRRRRRELWSAAREVARARGTLSQLAETLAKDPGAVAWDLLGEVREELGDLEGALEATRRAHALEPRDASLGRRLVALLDRAGRPKEARQVGEELARALPGDAALAAEVADRQWQAGDHVEAGATMDRALGRFARQPTALEQLAELAGRWRDDRRAIRAWTRLTRLDPDSDVAVVGLGEAQFQAGDRAAARRTWAVLRRRASSPASGHLRLGEILLDHDLINDARDEAQPPSRRIPAQQRRTAYSRGLPSASIRRTPRSPSGKRCWRPAPAGPDHRTPSPRGTKRVLACWRWSPSRAARNWTRESASSGKR